MENKGETGLRGRNSRLPFGVNVNLNLSNNKNLADRLTCKMKCANCFKT